MASSVAHGWVVMWRTPASLHPLLEGRGRPLVMWLVAGLTTWNKVDEAEREMVDVAVPMSHM